MSEPKMPTGLPKNDLPPKVSGQEIVSNENEANHFQEILDIQSKSEKKKKTIWLISQEIYGCLLGGGGRSGRSGLSEDQLKQGREITERLESLYVETELENLKAELEQLEIALDRAKQVETDGGRNSGYRSSYDWMAKASQQISDLKEFLASDENIKNEKIKAEFTLMANGARFPSNYSSEWQKEIDSDLLGEFGLEFKFSKSTKGEDLASISKKQ